MRKVRRLIRRAGTAGVAPDAPRLRVGHARQPAEAPCGLTAAAVAELEAELRRSRTMAAQTERLGRIGSWTLDLDSNALVWSEGTYRIFGLSPSLPITLERAIGFYAEPARTHLEGLIAGAIASGEPFDTTLQHMTADDMTRWVRCIGQLQAGADGRRQLVGVVRDVTSERTTEDQLRHLAGHDTLTGLSNRRVFLDTLHEALRGTPSLTLILLDLDRFKDVNDLHGHGVGDALLVEVGRRLRAGVRGSDTVARLGGDEFALLLYGVATPEAAERRLAAILELFRTPVELACGSLDIGVSLGAATHPDGGTTPEEMLKNADVALYKAKSLGRGQGCVFHRDLGAAVEERLSLLAEVRAGLRRGELDVFYQPIIDLRSGAVRGFEALVRWRHPRRGVLAPGAFLDALADPLLSAEIGAFVLSRSLRQLRHWLDAGLEVACVNVNISESQLRQGEALFRQVAMLLDSHALTPDRLKLEILESAFLGYQSAAIVETLARLQRFGVVVALDDFGTGYASLTHLKQFDVGRIKVDQSFIRGIGTDPSSRAITRAIIDLGRNLGIRVTAEGVEEVSQLAVLLEAGCDCGQGYLFSRPLPAEAVPEFLGHWTREGPAILAAAGRPGRPGTRRRSRFTARPLLPAVPPIDRREGATGSEDAVGAEGLAGRRSSRRH